MKKTVIYMVIILIISNLIECNQLMRRRKHKHKHRTRKPINFKAIKTSENMQTMIRNRGTFVYQLLNIAADDATAKKNADDLNDQFPDKATHADPTKCSFNNDMIELPAICNLKWTMADIVEILEKGKEIITEWLKGTPDENKANKDVFANMPILDAENFAKFYNYIVAGVPDDKFIVRVKMQTQAKDGSKQEGDNERLQYYFTGEQATKDAKILARTVNFDIFGRLDDRVSWLQFWVYQCSDGEKPLNRDWMSEVDTRPAHQGVRTGGGAASLNTVGAAGPTGPTITQEPDQTGPGSTPPLETKEAPKKEEPKEETADADQAKAEEAKPEDKEPGTKKRKMKKDQKKLVNIRFKYLASRRFRKQLKKVLKNVIIKKRPSYLGEFTHKNRTKKHRLKIRL